MLTGKENYYRAIMHGSPEWVPVQLHCPFDCLHEQDEGKKSRIVEMSRQFPNDLLKLEPVFHYVQPPAKVDGGTRWVDHWGTGWADDGNGAKTEFHPLEAGYELMDSYPFPDPHEPEIFVAAERALAQRGDRYVLAPVWFTLFERMWMLRGFDNMLLDPLVNENDFFYLQDIVLGFALGMIDEWLRRGVDGVFFSDDWGSQRGLLINPDDWRRYWKPAYEQLFGRVRGGGAHVWMHLCGDIRAILPDLIELGLDVLNPVQPQAMSIRELARDFGGNVCFNGGVDVQGVLVAGTPAEVRAHVCELMNVFARSDGGYVLTTSHGIMPETPLDNIIALYETALGLCKPLGR
ncbi:MAG TPA: uroporphyrinogen decarboxylase family protein [Candidatus Hydrogenedentes bacterium]|nr:uroporphyrinogen decarboxylase family protein [Candidatus Hydrogenedentota bacterium]